MNWFEKLERGPCLAHILWDAFTLGLVFVGFAFVVLGVLAIAAAALMFL